MQSCQTNVLKKKYDKNNEFYDSLRGNDFYKALIVKFNGIEVFFSESMPVFGLFCLIVVI